MVSVFVRGGFVCNSMVISFLQGMIAMRYNANEKLFFGRLCYCGSGGLKYAVGIY